MKLYHYRPNVEQYGYVKFLQDEYTHETGFPVIGRFHLGQSMASSWEPLAVEINTTRGSLGDFPRASVGPPIMSQKAWGVLRPLIGEAAEALPIITPLGIYLALNVLAVVNCLDYAHSELTWYPERAGGGLHRIIKYQLKSTVVADRPMFKIPEEMTRVIVSEDFKRSVIAASLKGLDFSDALC